MKQKEIKIDLLPEDFRKEIAWDFCFGCVITMAIRRYFKTKINQSTSVFVTETKAEIGNDNYTIKKGFLKEDHYFVQSQYSKGTNTIYYITLIPQ